MRADVVARAMRLIADGAVDRDGVAGLAARLGYTSRHLRRLLTDEVGAGPLALARAQRAQTARILIETTDLPFARVAFAAGFSSIRQFNDTVRAVFATTPSELRSRAGTSERRATVSEAGRLSLRLPYREPCDVDASIAFLGARAVAGIEEIRDGVYRRSLDLPHGLGVVGLAPGPGYVHCDLRLDDLRDLQSAVVRCRALLDLDADPQAVTEHLQRDPMLGIVVAERPGRRMIGAVDGAEVAIRIVLGQQVSVAGARTVAARLVADYGTRLTEPHGAVTHRFPRPDVLAHVDPSDLPMPNTRAQALKALCAALANQQVTLDAGTDANEMAAVLLAIPGIGPWTVDLLRLRALGDPDVFLPTDLGVRRGLTALGLAGDARGAATAAQVWRPWRSYALHHLWAVGGAHHRPSAVDAGVRDVSHRAGTRTPTLENT